MVVLCFVSYSQLHVVFSSLMFVIRDYQRSYSGVVLRKQKLLDLSLAYPWATRGHSFALCLLLNF